MGKNNLLYNKGESKHCQSLAGRYVGRKVAPFWDPGVRPRVISPKNECICLRFARKAQKWGFSASGGTQGPISFATSQLLEFMDQAVTPIRWTPRTQGFWQGAICKLWTSQFGEHWRHWHSVRLSNFRPQPYLLYNKGESKLH